MGLVILAATTLIGTIAMIYEFARNGRSSHFDPEHKVSASVDYDKGTFTLERWTCETPKFIKAYESMDFGMQCAGERGSRVLLMVMLFSSLAMAGGLVWDWRSTHGLVERKVDSRDEDYY